MITVSHMAQRNRLWRHRQNVNNVSETRDLLLFTIYGLMSYVS